MDKNSHTKSEKYFFPIVIVISIGIFSINFLGIKSDLIRFLDFAVQPIGEAAYSTSKEVKDVFGVFSEVKSLKNDYYDLLEKYMKLEADTKMVTLLNEEKLTLEKQLEFKNNEDNYLKAEVLDNGNNSENETLIINQGKEDGVKEGNIVVIGNIYIGTIIEVSSHTAKVRLPMSRASYLKVIIINQDSGDNLDGKILNGVAVGYSNVINVENIETKGDLAEGYSVIIKDTKIPKLLYLGSVFTIKQDPTAASRSLEVVPPVDYQYVKYVYVLINQ